MSLQRSLQKPFSNTNRAIAVPLAFIFAIFSILPVPGAFAATSPLLPPGQPFGPTVPALQSPVQITNIQATPVMDSVEDISCNTSAAAVIQVEYWESWDSSAPHLFSDRTTFYANFHWQRLRNLKSNTDYSFKIHAWNQSNVEAISAVRTFRTLSGDSTPPVISSVAANAATGEITWRTDEPTFGRVEYSTYQYTDVNGNLAGARWVGWDNTASTNKAMTLPGLTVGTTYYFRVHAKDTTGNMSKSQILSFKYNGGDTIPPTILSFDAEKKGDNNWDFHFTLDEPSYVVLEYSLYSNMANPIQYGINWTGPTTGGTLNAHFPDRQILYVRLKAKDAAGNLSLSQIVQIDNRIQDTTPPAFLSFDVVVSQTQPTVSFWADTDEEALMTVKIWLKSNPNDVRTGTSSSWGTHHTVIFNGLERSEDYEYEATVQDRAGNKNVKTGQFETYPKIQKVTFLEPAAYDTLSGDITIKVKTKRLPSELEFTAVDVNDGRRPYIIGTIQQTGNWSEDKIYTIVWHSANDISGRLADPVELRVQVTSPGYALMAKVIEIKVDNRSKYKLTSELWTAAHWSASGILPFRPDLVNNGIKDHAWHTDGADPGSTITLDTFTDNEQEFVKVQIKADGTYKATWDIQYSDNGMYWTTAVSNWNAGASADSQVSWDSVGKHRWWRLVKKDTKGPGAWQGELQFFAVDRPPAVTNVRVTNITTTSAKVGWDTDEPADTQVEYWLQSDPTNTRWTALDSNLVKSHNVTLTNLTPDTAYGFRVYSKDKTGNLTTSEGTFRTYAPTAPQKPVTMYEILANRTVTDSWAEIWLKIRDTEGKQILLKIEYKLKSETNWHPGGNWTKTGDGDFRFRLSGLQAGQDYEYRVTAIKNNDVDHPVVLKGNFRTRVIETRARVFAGIGYGGIQQNSVHLSIAIRGTNPRYRPNSNIRVKVEYWVKGQPNNVMLASVMIINDGQYYLWLNNLSRSTQYEVRLTPLEDETQIGNPVMFTFKTLT